MLEDAESESRSAIRCKLQRVRIPQLHARKLRPAEIAKLAGELETETILVGLPLHLNGTEGEQAKDARSFAAKLAQSATGIQIEFVDERLTTVEAEERLADRRGGWRKKRDRIDAFAAAFILQNYLNSR